MKKVLLALFVLGMAATSQASIVLDTGRHGTESIKITGMEINRGKLVVTAEKGGSFVIDEASLRDAGVSALEMVTLLNKYNNSKSVLKISAVSYLEHDSRFIHAVSLNF